MSRHHATQSYRVQDLVKQVQETDVEDWEHTFDIILGEDNAIWDVLEARWFDTIVAWAEFQIELDSEDDDERDYGYRYDDE